jgi:hypothetical protein
VAKTQTSGEPSACYQLGMGWGGTLEERCRKKGVVLSQPGTLVCPPCPLYTQSKVGSEGRGRGQVVSVGFSEAVVAPHGRQRLHGPGWARGPQSARGLALRQAADQWARPLMLAGHARGWPPLSARGGLWVGALVSREA